MNKIDQPLLAMIASATNNELAKCVQYLKNEKKSLSPNPWQDPHTT